MPSPFPGMDPYLELPSLWTSIHTRLLVGISNYLKPQMPKGFRVDVEQYVRLELRDDFSSYKPDLSVRVTDSKNDTQPRREYQPGSTIKLTRPKRSQRKRFVKVVDLSNNSIVTVIEVLSYSDKSTREDGRRYRLKRVEFMESGLNFVEIDLLRAGRRPIKKPEVRDYYALVSRSTEYPKAEIWDLSILEPLPVIPIPVSPLLPEPVLDLQAVLAKLDDEGGYSESFNYRIPPKPALRADDVEWATKLTEAFSKNTNVSPPSIEGY
ncbi:MAG: DUF4058 family protein [Fimbriiglobus sp.]